MFSTVTNVIAQAEPAAAGGGGVTVSLAVLITAGVVLWCKLGQGRPGHVFAGALMGAAWASAGWGIYQVLTQTNGSIGQVVDGLGSMSF